YISGPGIFGPFSNDAVNIATIPGTDIPVGVNSINSGFPQNNFNCLDVNPNYEEDSFYFVNNIPQVSNSIAHAGHTVSFNADVVLQIGEEYHFKFGIANAADNLFQSAAILRRESVSTEGESGLLELEVNTEDIVVAEEGIYVVGNFNYFTPEPLTQVSENIYRYTSRMVPYTNVVYRFLNGSDLSSKEFIPGSCSIEGPLLNDYRHLELSGTNVVLEPVCFGTCQVCYDPLKADVTDLTKLKVFPNPSQGQLQIVAPKDGFARLQVFNILGSVVYDERVFLNTGTNYEFELEERGLYKVNLSFDDGGYSSTVIVE
ncbi:MAG: choice-of-anchor L domain-containing protein, partial [Bacteroidota bacterium]